MPKVKQEYLPSGATFIKAESLQLNLGDEVEFKITGPHQETKAGAALPVEAHIKGQKVSGLLPLNKTNMNTLVQALGDDSDKWPGHTFKASVAPQRNPKTNTLVRSFIITNVK